MRGSVTPGCIIVNLLYETPLCRQISYVGVLLATTLSAERIIGIQIRL